MEFKKDDRVKIKAPHFSTFGIVIKGNYQGHHKNEKHIDVKRDDGYNGDGIQGSYICDENWLTKI